MTRTARGPCATSPSIWTSDAPPQPDSPRESPSRSASSATPGGRRFASLAAASLVLSRPMALPLCFGQAMENLRPSGIFQIGGGSWYAFDRFADTSPPATSASTTAPARRRKSDYFLSVGADDARFDLLGGRIPLTGLRG